MGSTTPGVRDRAIALSALLAGDYELDGLRGAVPHLSLGARAAASRLRAGPPEELASRLAAELARLAGRPTAEGLCASWPRAPRGGMRPVPGLRRLVHHWANPAGPQLSLPDALAPLAAESSQLGELLVTLSVALMRRAAQGDHWAARLLATEVAALGREAAVSPRLLPGLAWVGAALADDGAALEALSGSWPAELADLLARCGRPAAETSAELRVELEEELARHG